MSLDFKGSTGATENVQHYQNTSLNDIRTERKKQGKLDSSKLDYPVISSVGFSFKDPEHMFESKRLSLPPLESSVKNNQSKLDIQSKFSAALMTDRKLEDKQLSKKLRFISQQRRIVESTNLISPKSNDELVNFKPRLMNDISQAPSVTQNSNSDISSTINQDTNERKKQVDQIIKRCYREHQQSENQIKEIDYEMLLHNLKQSHFVHIVDQVKELEYASAQTIPKLFQYREKIKEELDDEEFEVTKEYRSGKMDPSREVAQFEKGRRVKKSIGKRKDLELKFKALKEQKSIITGINYLSLA